MVGAPQKPQNNEVVACGTLRYRRAGFLHCTTSTVHEMSFTKREISGTYADMLDKAFGVKNSFWEYNPGKFLMPDYFDDIAKDVLEAQVRKDDVWLISYPRTGSTWLQEIIWLIGNNFDFDKAKNTIQQLRAPMIELSTYLAEYTSFITEYGNSVEIVNNWPSPRFIKTHMPYDFLPTQIYKVKPKIIYIVREPKDLCVSYYHHCKLMHDMVTSFEDFAEMFLNDTIPLGSVFNHYMPFWERREEENILFLKYEDLKLDTKSGIRKIADFMTTEITGEQIDQLCDFLSVENMKKNTGCNWSTIADSQMGSNYFGNTGKSFIRKGEIGDWQNYMNEDLAKRFDEWIARSTEGTGLSFD